MAENTTGDIEMQIDVGKAVLDDLEILDGSRGNVKGSELLDVLDRIVIGGVRERGIPLAEMKTIAMRIAEALKAEGDKKN
ncbi:MAG: hypothetical protein JXA14_26105 [Anaerolineae bacterium]|nr:hypothetical protein [Anaerolineae bacterium]